MNSTISTTHFRRRDDNRRVSGCVVRRAFTLMEMLLVLVVMLVFAGIAWVVLRPQFAEYELKDATERVRADLANTRNLAVEYSVLYQFRYEPNGSRYLIVPYEVDNDVLDNPGISLAKRYRLISRQLPKGLIFTSAADPGVTQVPEDIIPVAKEFFQEFPDPAKLQGVGWSNPILFRADGTAMGTAFRVQDEKKRYIQLSIRELTAAVSVTAVKQGGR